MHICNLPPSECALREAEGITGIRNQHDVTEYLLSVLDLEMNREIDVIYLPHKDGDTECLVMDITDEDGDVLGEFGGPDYPKKVNNLLADIIESRRDY